VIRKHIGEFAVVRVIIPDTVYTKSVVVKKTKLPRDKHEDERASAYTIRTWPNSEAGSSLGLHSKNGGVPAKNWYEASNFPECRRIAHGAVRV